MSEAKQMLFARNVICICIEKKESGDYIGLYCGTNILMIPLSLTELATC